MERIKRFSSVYIFYLFFFLFMINRLFFFSPGITEKTISCLVYPFLKVRSVLVYPFVFGFSRAQSIVLLQKKIDDLTQENENLQEKIIQQNAIRLFSQEIEEIVQFSCRYHNDNKILAKVLMSIISEKEDVFFIDVGQSQDIKKDDVVVYKNMLVGRVVEIYPWFSKVALISDKRCKISAQCQIGSTGIFSGKNNGEIELGFMPHFKNVAIGDMILSTGNGLVYPQGFALGEVVSIETDNVSHRVQAKTLIDFSSLLYVYVLKRQ